MSKLLLVKWGGALIAPKNLDIGAIDVKSLDYLIKATQEYIKNGRQCIVVHGAGNYHKLVRELFARKPRNYEEEFKIINKGARTLNSAVLERAHLHRLLAGSFHPSDGFVDKSGNLIWNLEDIVRCLEQGVIPIVHSDIIRSEHRPEGWEIFSGENVLMHLAHHCSARYNNLRLVLVSNVDGVYDLYPDDKNAKLIPVITKENKSLLVLGAHPQDVSGGMLHKVDSMYRFSQKIHLSGTHCEIAIIGIDEYRSAMHKECLEKAISSGRIKGTYISGI